MYLKLSLLPPVSDLTYFPDNEAHKMILAYDIFQNTMFTKNKWSNSSISKWTHVSLPNHVSLSNIPSNFLTYLLKINLQPPCCSQQDLVWLLYLALHFVLLLILALIERSFYHLLKKKRHVSTSACKNKLSLHWPLTILWREENQLLPIFLFVANKHLLFVHVCNILFQCDSRINYLDRQIFKRTYHYIVYLHY